MCFQFPLFSKSQFFIAVSISRHIYYDYWGFVFKNKTKQNINCFKRVVILELFLVKMNTFQSAAVNEIIKFFLDSCYLSMYHSQLKVVNI